MYNRSKVPDKRRVEGDRNMRKLWMPGVWLFASLIVLGACQGNRPEQQTPAGTALSLQIRSTAFQAEATIPQHYTCDGKDASPPLTWSTPPVGTQNLVLILDDPDAPVGTWDHWVLFNIPYSTVSLPEGIPAEPVIDGIGVHGSNSWRRIGYGGPCPPQGAVHRYYFRLYALDTPLDLEAGASKKEVEEAMQSHILAEGQLMGRYGR
jgi:Raf kinase inhibitor-like YbhB/YbcL family protein